MNEREFLIRLAKGPVPGDQLARELGVTRAAVWKRVQALRDGGIEVQAQPGHGYHLAQPLDLLDAASLRTRLHQLGCDGQVRIRVEWSLDSTNSELLRLPAPDEGLDVLLAEHQTGGRGRRGRVWSSPLAAHLYLSLSRTFTTGLARLPGLSLVTGTVIASTLSSMGVKQIALKWPNDVVVAGRKLGGILVEASGEAAGNARAVIGIGVNVRMPGGIGDRIDQPWTDLASILAPLPDRNLLAARLVAELVPAFERFEREGLAPFLARYHAFDSLSGRQVAVLAGDGHHVVGVAEGVGEEGALLVRIGEDIRRFHSGEVSVRRQ